MEDVVGQQGLGFGELRPEQGVHAPSLPVMELVGVVGAALVRDGTVLASRRTEPPHLAGFWEFPGGKVEAGETDGQAVVRELSEELRVEVEVGSQLGEALAIGRTAQLRVYLCRLVSGEPELVDHDEHRWLGPDELGDVTWLPVDLPLLEPLRAVLLSQAPAADAQ